MNRKSAAYWIPRIAGMTVAYSPFTNFANASA